MVLGHLVGLAKSVHALRNHVEWGRSGWMEDRRREGEIEDVFLGGPINVEASRGFIGSPDECFAD